MRRIVLIGDSICMGYLEAVRESLAGLAEVWAPEEKGGTSENVLAHLDAWALSRHPHVLHINCGLHDLRKAFDRDTAVVPLVRYAENVRRILTRVKTETEVSVVWALTTPVNQEWHHNSKSFDRFEADVVAYNRVASDIARELGIVVNDLFSIVNSAGRDRLLLPDGVHFKPEGSILLGKTVVDCIMKVLFAGE